MLVNCVNCGSRVSDTATICPACKKRPTIDYVECALCKQKLPREKAITRQVTERHSQIIPPEQKSFHSSCLENFKQEYLKLPSHIGCPECGKNVAELWKHEDFLYIYQLEERAHNRKICPYCGYNKLDFWFYDDFLKFPSVCGKCKLPLYPGLSQFMKDPHNSLKKYHYPLCVPDHLKNGPKPQERSLRFGKLFLPIAVVGAIIGGVISMNNDSGFIDGATLGAILGIFFVLCLEQVTKIKIR